MLDKMKEEEIIRKNKELEDQKIRDDLEKRRLLLEEQEAALKLEKLRMEEAKKKNLQTTPRVYVAASK